MKHAFMLFILGSIFTATGFAQKTIQLNKGWNNIGSLCTCLPADDMTFDPPAIIVSPFYGYNGAYYSATTLEAGQGYWVKAAESGSLTFETVPPDACGTMKVGYGGAIYNTVEIGGVCWLKENLDIGTRVNGSADQQNDATIEKYCYDDDPANCVIHGGLYQWNEAMQYNGTPGAQGICPAGWHMPTSAEFSTLGLNVAFNGNALKEVGQGSGLGAGTNTSGFSALLSGERAPGGTFTAVSIDANIWTSDQNGPDPFFTNLTALSDQINQGIDIGSTRGLSVRCIQD